MMLQKIPLLDDKVLEFLGDHPQSSAKEILAGVSAKGHYSLQAIYKSLNRLKEQGSVVKHRQRFSLRLSWLSDLSTFVQRSETAHFQKLLTELTLPAPGRKQRWRFRTLPQLNDWWAQVLLLLTHETGGAPLLGWNPHPWFHLLQREEEAQFIRSLQATGTRLYLMVGGQTPLDRWAEQFWRDQAVEYSFATGPFDGKRPLYLNVIGSYVVTIQLDRETTAAIDTLYERTKSVTTLPIAAVLKLLQSKISASLAIEQNPEKAAQLSRTFSRYFGVQF